MYIFEKIGEKRVREEIQESCRYLELSNTRKNNSVNIFWNLKIYIHRSTLDAIAKIGIEKFQDLKFRIYLLSINNLSFYCIIIIFIYDICTLCTNIYIYICTRFWDKFINLCFRV